MDTDGGRIERLESSIAAQQQRIEELQKRVKELESQNSGVGLSRRRTLEAGALLGLLGIGVTTASGDPAGQIGTADRQLDVIHTAMVGTETNPVDTVHTSSLGTATEPVDTVHASALAGDLLRRDEPVTALSGDIIVDDLEPDDPVEGDIWLETTTGRFGYWDGTEWAAVGQSGVPYDTADIEGFVDHYWRVDSGTGGREPPGIGDVDLELVSGEWVSGSRFVGNVAARYTAGEYWRTAEPISIDVESFTIGMWMEDVDASAETNPGIFVTNLSGGTAGANEENAGHRFLFEENNEDEYRLQVGTGAEVRSQSFDVDFSQEAGFCVLSADGDDHRVRVWDEAGTKVTDNAHSLDRPSLDGDRYLVGATNHSNDWVANKVQDALYVSTTEELTDSQVQQLVDRRVD